MFTGYLLDFFISFILAFIVAFSATPIAKKIAFKVGAVDIPKDDRRMHRKPIARFGGLAIVAGFMICMLFNLAGELAGVTNALEVDIRFWGIMAGIIILETGALIDDIKPLSWKIKISFQVLSALAVVLTGTRILTITNPFSQFGMTELPGYISYPVTLLWIIGITNAINFIDGLDGLAAGVSSISYLSLFFVAVIMGYTDTAMMTVILAGAALGFLPYNFNPAKIFMGETGSAFLGFTLAVISVQGAMKLYATVAIAVPLLVLGLPLFDTIFAIIRRLKDGKSPMHPDRGHLHHRLVDMGLSHKQSVVAMYTVSAALGLCAIVLADKGAISAIILVVALSVFVIGGAKYMSEMTGEDQEEKPAENIEEDQNDEKKTTNVVLNQIEEK